MDEIISEFLVESYEGLDQIDQNLIVLEESPDDVGILKEIFRTLHTIKGTCGVLGFGKLERLAHAAGEDLPAPSFHTTTTTHYLPPYLRMPSFQD